MTIGIAAVEVWLVVKFGHARRIYHEDLGGPCLDECLSTFGDMIVWGIAMIAWPLVAASAAFILYIVLVARKRRADSRTK